MPKEPHLDVVDCGERRGGHIRKEFKGHGGRVVRDTDPIGAQRCQVREAEEGLELCVGAELDVDGGGGAVGCDGRVEGGDDLGGEGGAGDGADRVGCVVSEVVFVGVGQGADLEEGFGGEQVGRRDGGVVNSGDVEVVEDYGGLLLAWPERRVGKTGS